jgi:hypothetical protein
MKQMIRIASFDVPTLRLPSAGSQEQTEWNLGVKMLEAKATTQDGRNQ